MLNYLFQELSSQISFLNVFSYITFRTGIAIFTSLLVVLFFGQTFINYLKSSAYFNQPIRDDGPVSHIIKKAGTPTFGGINYIWNSCFNFIMVRCQKYFCLNLFIFTIIIRFNWFF